VSSPTCHAAPEDERSVRDILVNHGMNEIINFSFISPDAADKLLLAADISAEQPSSLPIRWWRNSQSCGPAAARCP